MLKNKSTLQLVLLFLILYAVILLFSYYDFRYLFLPAKNEAEEFDYRNWLTYNFSLKAILYPFRILIMLSIIYFGLFIAQVKAPFTLILKCTLIGEMITFLPNIARGLYFYLYQNQLTLESYQRLEEILSLNFILGISEGIPNNILEPINLHMALYFLVASILIKEQAKVNHSVVVLFGYLYAVYAICHIVWSFFIYLLV
jgi:hypothetical protein